MQPMVGPELEFYVCEHDEAGGPAGSATARPGQRLRGRPQGRSARPAAAMLQAAAGRRAAGDRRQPRVLAAASSRSTSGTPSSLDAADRAFRLKSAVQEMARQRGQARDVHGQAVQRRGRLGLPRARLDQRRRRRATCSATPTAPDGLSDDGRHAIAGVLAHAPALAALLNPTINSYKRFGPDTLAPWLIDWGLDNRSAMVRIPPERGARRPDGSAARATRPRIRTWPWPPSARPSTSGSRTRLEPPAKLEGYGYDPAKADLLPQRLPGRAGRAGRRHELRRSARRVLRRRRSWPTSATRSSGSSGYVTDWEFREYAYHL